MEAIKVNEWEVRFMSRKELLAELNAGYGKSYFECFKRMCWNNNFAGIVPTAYGDMVVDVSKQFNGWKPIPKIEGNKGWLLHSGGLYERDIEIVRA